MSLAELLSRLHWPCVSYVRYSALLDRFQSAEDQAYSRIAALIEERDAAIAKYDRLINALIQKSQGIRLDGGAKPPEITQRQAVEPLRSARQRQMEGTERFLQQIEEMSREAI